MPAIYESENFYNEMYISNTEAVSIMKFIAMVQTSETDAFIQTRFHNGALIIRHKDKKTQKVTTYEASAFAMSKDQTRLYVLTTDLEFVVSTMPDGAGYGCLL